MGMVTERLWHKAGQQRVPLTGAFELLPICNLKCKMCYIRKSVEEVQQLGGLISAEEWLDYAKQARDLGLLYPLLTGGEPFVRKDLFKILEGMQKLGLQVSINTNATLIDQSVGEWLGKHKPTRVNITLYGANEDSYQNLCGDGDAFNRVHRAVEWLKKYQVPIKFNTSITQENEKDLEEIISYAKSVDVPIQVATYMFPPLRRDKSMVGKNERLEPEQAALARVKADWLQGNPEWFLKQAARFYHFVPVTEEMLMKQSSKKTQEMTCRAGRCSFWLDWQGNLGNCGMYSSTKVPVKGRTFAEAWKQVVEETEQVRYSPVCTNCPNFRLCHACIAMVYNECGDINGRPEYLCRMNQASAHYYQEYAQLLLKDQETVNVSALQESDGCDLEML